MQSRYLPRFSVPADSCQTFSAIWLALTRDDAACPVTVAEHSSACAACKLVCPRLQAWSRTPSAWKLEFPSRRVAAEHSSARHLHCRTAPLRHSPRASSASLEPRTAPSPSLKPCSPVPSHLSLSTESQSETPHHSHCRCELRLRAKTELHSSILQ